MADQDVIARVVDALPTVDAPLATTRLGKVVRSLSVSVMTTGLSLSILAVLTRTGLTAPATANVIATVAGIGPSFILNRRWAWRRSGPSHLRREVAPFWAYAVTSLLLSTLAVDRAAALADGMNASPTHRTLFVLAANLGSFAVLWCGQFLLLERLLSPTPSPS